jgi:hypothetical protein
LHVIQLIISHIFELIIIALFNRRGVLFAKR